MDSCPECQEELAEFSETAAQLALVPRDLLAEALEGQPVRAVPAVATAAPPAAAPADELVLQRTLRQLRAERTGVQRRRVLAVAAAAAALVAGPVITAAVVSGDRGQPIAGPAVPTAPAGRTVQGSDSATGLAGAAQLTAAPWGTKLQAKFTGEPRGATCQLFVVSTSGDRQLAGTWTVTDDAAGGSGTNIQGSVSIKDTDIARLEVQTSTGRQLLSIDA